MNDRYKLYHAPNMATLAAYLSAAAALFFGAYSLSLRSELSRLDRLEEEMRLLRERTLVTESRLAEIANRPLAIREVKPQENPSVLPSSEPSSLPPSSPFAKTTAVGLTPPPVALSKEDGEDLAAPATPSINAFASSSGGSSSAIAKQPAIGEEPRPSLPEIASSSEIRQATEGRMLPRKGEEGGKSENLVLAPLDTNPKSSIPSSRDALATTSPSPSSQEYLSQASNSSLTANRRPESTEGKEGLSPKEERRMESGESSESAKILASNEAQRRVMLSVGASSGIQPGKRFTVWRGGKYVGDIRVIRVFSNMSACEIVTPTKYGMRVGDLARAAEAVNES